MREIDSNLLFLGNAADARDLRLLYDHRIAAVVDLALNEPPARLTHDMIYFRIPLCDGGGNGDTILEVAIRCVAALVAREVRTLVACRAGMSRAPAIAAAALALVRQSPPDECLTSIIADGPHDVSPALWTAVQGVYDELECTPT
ncbi:MAG: dual specificity protein phosphatase [Thermoguttaceae bacterium]|jgi:protein-tyrosine phosphatase|nr:dual specificity protein phosphatase [Thermoguttaceae bacterium]